MKKKLIALLLAVVMTLSLLPVTALAADGEELVPEETLTEEPAPVEEEIPVEEPAPAEEEALTEEPAPVEEIPAEEPAPVEEEIPAEEPAPVEEIPAEEPAPVEEEIPAEEPTPVEEEAPAEEETPAEEEIPAEEPAEEETPVEEEFPADAAISAEAETAESLTTRTVVYVNPIYRNVISEEELQLSDAAAAEHTAKSYDASGYVSKNSAAAALRSAMVSRTANVTLEYYTTTGVGLSTDAAFEALFAELRGTVLNTAFAHTGNTHEGDYLRFQYGGYRASASYFEENNKNYFSVDLSLSYYTTAAQESTMNSAVSSLISQLNLSGKNDYQKIKAIYDWITANVTYDYANLNNDSYKLKYTGYAALVNRTAVCQGYSVLFYRLALEAGVDARVVSSDPMNHAWNVARPVSADNKYYYLDSTWDAGSSSYYYFLRGKTAWQNSCGHDLGDEYYNSSYASYPVPAADFDPSQMKPVITQQPANKSAAAGKDAKFTVTASGSNLTYQWQYRKSSSGSWSKTTATGNNTATLTVSATLAKNGYQYRCRVTSGSTTVNSKAATLTVWGITAQPASKSAAAGSNAKFTVTASGSNLTYQWQYRKSTSGSWSKTTATGYNTATLTVPATLTRNGYQYRCRVTSGSTTVNSKAATLTVTAAAAKPVITTQPANKSVAAGRNAKFTVTATGSNLKYQWQYRTSSSGSWRNSPATGNTTATLTVSATASKNGYQYRCRVTSGSTTVNSKAATLTVRDSAAINAANFPDATFRSYVQNFDTDGNGKFSPAELSAVMYIDVRNGY